MAESPWVQTSGTRERPQNSRFRPLTRALLHVKEPHDISTPHVVPGVTHGFNHPQNHSKPQQFRCDNSNWNCTPGFIPAVIPSVSSSSGQTTHVESPGTRDLPASGPNLRTSKRPSPPHVTGFGEAGERGPCYIPWPHLFFLSLAVFV